MIDIVQKHFYLAYQPIINRDSQVVKFEVLIRFDAQFPFSRNPQDIIEKAEEDPLTIASIDHAVLNQLVHDLTHWMAQGYGMGRLSFALNASPITLAISDQYIAHLTALPLTVKSRLEIEVLESKIPPELEHLLRANMQKLAKQGFQISLDDFGVGYACVRKLTFDGFTNIKLDGCLTPVEQCDQTYQIVRSVVELAHNLNKTVTAEKVETQLQFDTLIELGCDYFQGWYFSKAIACADLSAYLLSPAHQIKITEFG